MTNLGARSAPNGKAFVVGAGLAGLSAATILVSRGVAVTVIEAAGQAGGRCRSYFECRHGWCHRQWQSSGPIGQPGGAGLSGADRRARRADGPPRAQFAFVDLHDGKRWMLRPNEGGIPYWVLRETRRVPGTKPSDYLKYASLLWADKKDRYRQECCGSRPLWERLMRPFLLAALNTEPEDSSAALAGAVLRGTLAKGGRHYRPRIAHPTLAAAFVDPALNYLKAKGATLQLSTRLRDLAFDGRNAMALNTAEATLPVASGDVVVMAVPPWSASDLIPNLTAPNEFRAIVNAHFKMTAPAGSRDTGVIAAPPNGYSLSMIAFRLPCRGQTPLSTRTAKTSPSVSGPMWARRLA